MKRILIVCTLALALTGCSTFGKIETAFGVLTGATVSPQAVVIAANTFDALEATATNYLRLKKCIGANGPVCRDPGATKVLIPAVQEARGARNDLEAFLKAHPGQLGPSGLYDALQTAIARVESIVKQYNIRGVQ